jgi:hypothetical protein
MIPRPRGLAAFLVALVFLGSCSSGTGIVFHPSIAALAGRYTLSDPISFANGVTIVADTLILAPDRGLARHQWLNGPGPIGDFVSASIGSYSLDGSVVVLAFNCVDGGCFGTHTLRASVIGREGQVTRLLLNEDGRRAAYDRIP